MLPGRGDKVSVSASNADRLALFEAFPALAQRLPYIPLATTPTPVQQADAFAREHGLGGLFIKRDDLSSAIYGGNKTRKLGFLLGAAKQQGARSVITFGAAGSNHALATAVFCQRMGLNATLVLGPQHNSHHVRGNLRAMYESGAALHPCPWRDTATTTVRCFYHHWEQDGRPPYVIPPGGSSPVGALGFVNAAFELARQIDAGQLPAPDVIYVASGTMGTCMGLALGLSALQMNTQVMAVRVTHEPFTGMTRAHALFNATNALLRQQTTAFPACTLTASRFVIREEFFGRDYALFTPTGMAAIDTAAAQLDIALEGVYTGKAFAALLADAAAGHLRDKCVVFWNTYSGGPPQTTAPFDHTALPKALHTYFTSDTQPLARIFHQVSS